MESFLFLTATHAEDPAMPPKDNKSGAKDLSPQQLALIKLWIEQGQKARYVPRARSSGSRCRLA